MKRRWALIVAMAVMVGCSGKEDPQEDKSAPDSGETADRAERHTVPAGPAEYPAGQRQVLLKLARGALDAVVAGREMPKVEPAELPAALTAEKGCFVTLNKDGKLRGCIGYIFPRGPLYKAAMENARNAALHDRRFRPVRTAELHDIELEISVLTVPKPLEFKSLEDLLAKLRPHVDGVVFQAGGRQSTFLPQVWEKIPDKKDFMTQLAKKSGLALPDWAWTPDRIKILTYQAEVFDESGR